MAGEITTTVVGNLTATPELRYTQGGHGVAGFTVVSTPRVMRNGEWEDGEPFFLRCNAWRKLGENIAESLNKGDRVVVTGRLRQRSFEVDGQKRTVVEMEVEDLGVSVKFHPAESKRAERSTGEQRGAQGRGEADPWGSGGPGGYAADPPFHHPRLLDEYNG